MSNEGCAVLRRLLFFQPLEGRILLGSEQRNDFSLHKYIHCWTTPGIFKRVPDRNIPSAVTPFKRTDLDAHGNPRTPIRLHFVQLATQNEISEYSNRQGDGAEESNSYGGVRRSSGRTILGCFILLLGAALSKFAYWVTDQPTNG